MVASSKTIDLTGRPPVRRRISGVLSINPERRSARSGKPERGTTDAGNPNEIVPLDQHRPGFPTAPGYPFLLKTPGDQSPAPPPERLELLPSLPAADRYRIQGKP